MPKNPKQKTTNAAEKPQKAQSEKALALKSALRANLQKRKAQARAKASQSENN